MIQTPSDLFIVGLTGGIGSGKSAASDRFGALGARVVDTDVIAHQLTGAQGQALAPIRQAFGAQVFADNGALDRAALRSTVFADRAAREKLEAILHPLIAQHAQRQLAQTTEPYAVLVVPLLIESANYRERCDRIVVVDCPEAMQVSRVMARSGLSAAQAQQIMAAQISRAQRLEAADDVLHNETDLEQLHHQVERLHTQYLTEAEKKKSARVL